MIHDYFANHPNKDEATMRLINDLFPDMQSRHAFATKHRNLRQSPGTYDEGFRHGRVNMLNDVMRMLTANPKLPLMFEGAQLYKRLEEGA